MENKEWLEELKDRLITQDNLGTQDPIYVVYQKRRIYGLKPGYSDDYIMVDRIGEPIESYNEEACKPLYYKEVPEFVTACLTRAGCEEYLRGNGHNLNEPTIVVESAYRNDEMLKVREFFLHYD